MDEKKDSIDCNIFNNEEGITSGEALSGHKEAVTSQTNRACINQMAVQFCAVCGRGFNSIRCLMSHWKAHPDTDERGHFICKFCNRTFVSLQALGGHKASAGHKKALRQLLISRRN